MNQPHFNSTVPDLAQICVIAIRDLQRYFGQLFWSTILVNYFGQGELRKQVLFDINLEI